MKNWIEIAPLADIPRQGARIVKTPHGCIAIFRTQDDQAFAIDDQCPHKGGPLSDGIVHGHSVTCPLHNAVIALNTGEVTSDDYPPVKTYDIKINDGKIMLAVEAIEKAS